MVALFFFGSAGASQSYGRERMGHFNLKSKAWRSKVTTSSLRNFSPSISPL